ncbi:hypothetical protein RI367_008666 [Sorochytrium milnesiophthora]
MRFLFATIPAINGPRNPGRLWAMFHDALTDDIAHQTRQLRLNYEPTPEDVDTVALLEIDRLLQRQGQHLANFGTLPAPGVDPLANYGGADGQRNAWLAVRYDLCGERPRRELVVMPTDAEQRSL